MRHNRGAHNWPDRHTHTVPYCRSVDHKGAGRRRQRTFESPRLFRYRCDRHELPAAGVGVSARGRARARPDEQDRADGPRARGPMAMRAAVLASCIAAARGEFPSLAPRTAAARARAHLAALAPPSPPPSARSRDHRPAIAVAPYVAKPGVRLARRSAMRRERGDGARERRVWDHLHGRSWHYKNRQRSVVRSDMRYGLHAECSADLHWCGSRDGHGDVHSK